MSARVLHNSSERGSSKNSRTMSGRGRGQGAPLALGRRVCKTSPDVVGRQLRKISQDLALRHASCQVAQYVTDGDAGAPNARLAKSDGRINRDSVDQVHGGSLRHLPSASKLRFVGPTIRAEPRRATFFTKRRRLQPVLGGRCVTSLPLLNASCTLESDSLEREPHWRLDVGTPCALCRSPRRISCTTCSRSARPSPGPGTRLKRMDRRD